MGLREWMVDAGCNNVIEMKWWETQYYDSTIKFVFTPAQHWSRRGLTDENKSLWGSWCIIGARRKFFFAGDTGYYAKVFKQIGQRCGPFDLSAIPIGAYKPRYA
jgi:N-acyl-phosphatidylethanolamine-hydrolysing phospholipase D